MSWKFWKKKTVPQAIQEKNAAATQRVDAAKELASNKALTPEERCLLLMKTYREGKDAMVLPEKWMGSLLDESFQGKKIYLNTPYPAIVRTR